MSPHPWRPQPAGRQFDDTRRANRHWPLVLAEGDSWFSHPTEWNILWHLSAMGDYSIRRLASTGDKLLDMVREAPGLKPQYIRQLERRLDWSLLLFSGGGNDLLGSHLTFLLRHRDEVSHGWRGLIRDEALEGLLGSLRIAFQTVLYRTSQLQPDCHVLVHGYDYPFPRNQGAEFFWGALTVAGPWMYPVMAEQKGITDADTRYKITKELVDRFNRMLMVLAAEHERFHYVNLRNMLPSVQQWRDEIHPKSAGMRRMALEFKAVMDRITG